MEKNITSDNCIIKIDLEEGIIRVYSNLALWKFLDRKDRNHLIQLTDNIKSEYLQTFKEPLNISNRSLTIEILVHVYCDYLGLAFNRLVKIKNVQQLVNKLLKRAEVVDCGESAKDGNRWVWDILSPFTNIFLKVFPRNLSQTGLKKY